MVHNQDADKDASTRPEIGPHCQDATFLGQMLLVRNAESGCAQGSGPELAARDVSVCTPPTRAVAYSENPLQGCLSVLSVQQW